MPIQYPEILSLQENGLTFEYDERDTMLYALALGMGRDPHNAQELAFVYERELKAVPSLATVVVWGAGVSTERLGINYKMVLHGEEEIIFHRPMPTAARLVTDSGIAEVFDKGADKGAVIQRRTVLRDAGDNEPIATINRFIFARGDGGCGGATSGAPVPHKVPERPPDMSVVYESRPEQAALYRLCGDRNPLHIDPVVAASAGFTAPILHGLANYGVTCRAVLESYCEFDPTRIRSHAVRFSSPFYPGETLRIDLWRDGDLVSFDATALERDVKVIKNGKTVIGPSR
jgi:acyl dehydratase